ncbi:nucleoside-diphosphate-sugar epimerase [Kitasatospora sp. MAA19]|nr:nucleoside-diphosphate-sugar epimerase [Kitasatospora sp. MAA19]
MSKRALITGVTGQDGSYLAEHLISLEYEVWGLTRGQANPRKDRVSRLIPDLRFVDGQVGQCAAPACGALRGQIAGLRCELGESLHGASMTARHHRK